MKRLETRDRRVAAGGAVIAALLAILLWPSGDEPGEVELVPAEQRAAPAPPQAAPVAQAAPPAAPVPASSPEGLVLHGVMASGAVIGFPDGAQRYVAVGQDAAPGLKLVAVRLRHAVLDAGGMDYRLGFGGSARVLTPTGQAATVSPRTPAPAFSAAEAQRQAEERAQALQLRQALAPRQAGGQVTGYTLRPGASVAALAQAGLRPGDTILGVNGSRLGPEQLEELAWTIANSDQTQFEVERGGRRLRLSIGGPQ